MLSIPVGYYKLPTFVFHASLVRAVSSFMLDYTLLFHCFQISLLLFVLEQKMLHVVVDMSENWHSLVDH